jgi:uncharacterized RDD family membrane protein YckC
MNIESPGPATDLPTPSLKRRMACFVYEAMILFGIGLIPGALGALFVALTGQQHPLQSESALRLFAFALYAVYFTWFWSKRGQTLPMQTWHIQLVAQDGGTVSQARALARVFASCAWFVPAVVVAHLNGWTRWESLGAVLVGIVAYALLALLHPQRQFWHDTLCGTRLVSTKSAARTLRSAGPQPVRQPNP